MSDKEIKLEDERANFRDEEGNAYVVRCPKCHKENYISAVATGRCAWCGWEESEHER